MIKNKKGFTLSEVLISITIIGIIAAIVLPIFNYQYKKAFIENKLKKSYSTLANAINMSISHNGPPEQWPLGDDNDEWAKKYLLPYLRVDKYCGKSTTPDCIFTLGENNSTAKRVTKDIGSTYSRFYMNDSTQVAFKIVKSASADGIDIFIDIDGNHKGENKQGKDLFRYNIYAIVYNDGMKRNFKNAPSQLVLKPYGYGNSITDLAGAKDNWGSCKKGRRGEWCAALIMANGWKIPKDYPL